MAPPSCSSAGFAAHCSGSSRACCFWPVLSDLHENLWKTKLGGLCWSKRAKTKTLPAGGLRVRWLRRSSFTVGVLLRLTCTRKWQGTQPSKNHGKQEAGRGSSEFWISAAAARPTFTHIFGLTCRPFNFNMGIGRFGIKFWANGRKILHFQHWRWLRYGDDSG